MNLPEPPDLDPWADLLDGVNTIFESLGRGLVCLGPSFRVVRASPALDRLIGEGATAEAEGLPAAELFGEELFGESGGMRRALAEGTRREGWGATLRLPGRRPRFVSVTAAPLVHEPGAVCDPRVAYLVVVRPAEETSADDAPGVTLFAGMVARAPAMLRVFRLVETLRESDATVLVTGESGTGKELVARAVHQHSPNRDGPFIAVNCGALPGELLESELFGHVRGAFTGAVRDRVGRFEAAAGGTLFLDEIGDMPPHLQVKLLRVLQERTFERVGESRPRTTSARIIAATHRDLRRAALEGSFRDDLYYRLRVVPIEIPPLRRRRECLEPLARHLLARLCARHGRALFLTPDALRALYAYPWPGNVRELENALEYAVAVCPGQTVHAKDLPAEILDPAAAVLEAGEARPPAATGPALPAASAPPPAADDGDERQRLRRALDTHRWRRADTAAALGISRTTLWRKMREHGLDG